MNDEQWKRYRRPYTALSPSPRRRACRRLRHYEGDASVTLGAIRTEKSFDLNRLDMRAEGDVSITLGLTRTEKAGVDRFERPRIRAGHRRSPALFLSECKLNVWSEAPERGDQQTREKNSFPCPDAAA